MGPLYEARTWTIGHDWKLQGHGNMSTPYKIGYGGI